MSNFGDADKLAAARELQRSFSTRADAPRGSGRGSGSRRARAANIRTQLSATTPRAGHQDTAYRSGTRGRGGNVATRGRAGGYVNSPATRARINQRNPSARNASHPDNFSSGNLNQSGTFGQLSTGSEGSNNYGTARSMNAQKSNASTTAYSRGLGTSRFAEPEAAPVDEAPPPKRQQVDNSMDSQPVKSGRFVGFYQDPHDELEFVPDDAPVKEKRSKGLQTSRFASATPQSFSPDGIDSTVTTYTVDLDQANPRYEGFYQDADQPQIATNTQASTSPPTINDPHNQHAGFGGSGPNIPQSNSASETTTGFGSSTMQHTSTETLALQNSMNPALRESLDLYLQLTAQAGESDAMEIDEEL